MCYSKEQSITAWIINLTVCIYLLNTDIGNTELKSFILFLLYIGQMQLIDYIYYNNQECNIINKLTSKLGLFIVYLQPLVLYVLQLCYNSFSINTGLHILAFLYLIMIILYAKNQYIDLNCTEKDNTETKVCCSVGYKIDKNKTEDSRKDKAKWIFYNKQGAGLLNMVYIVLLLFLINNYSSKYKYIAYFVYFFSLILLHFKELNGIYYNYEIPRLWCYFTALSPLILLIIKE